MNAQIEAIRQRQSELLQSLMPHTGGGSAANGGGAGHGGDADAEWQSTYARWQSLGFRVMAAVR